MTDYHNFNHFICGKLLGDGCITKQNGRKPRFQFMHRTEDVGWATYCYEQLKNHIPLSAPTYQKVMDQRLKCGFSERYIVQARTDELITDLYRLWYPNGKKTLPFNYIEQFLDEKALAWWYQDDGHLKITSGTVCKIILSTDNFSTVENDMLIEILFNKFKLHFVKDGQNRLLIYDQFQIIYFLSLVSPWLHAAMSRKAMPIQPLRSIAARTTIYLPAKYELSKPTSEINERLNKLHTLFDSSTTEVCLQTIFPLFNLEKKEVGDVKEYQIVIDEKHRESLARIRQQTGLSVSQLAEYCFRA
ncbi:endonuclease [Sporosarcina sp. YIM B06819]|uniref:endonuclease n=1 Tax=Sporosarcina sp. YIM B06819 TaxID=3081769 RepID=UPI00298CC920|nr:endonuclease [Sporosarcina sp. YIM B06819]